MMDEREIQHCGHTMVGWPPKARHRPIRARLDAMDMDLYSSALDMDNALRAVLRECDTDDCYAESDWADLAARLTRIRRAIAEHLGGPR